MRAFAEPLRRRLTCVVAVVALVGVITPAAQADDEADDRHHQHGASGGHLPASARNVELVGKVRLTNVADGIADVAAFGNHAYLNAYFPECAGRPGAHGPGVHVVDIRDPAHPTNVAFLHAPANTYLGEGVHVMRVHTPFFSGDLLVHNNEPCDPSRPSGGGFSMWDVSNPTAPVSLGTFGDTTPPVPNQRFHTTHSAQGFTIGSRAFVVAQDNDEQRDVDIFEVTNPAAPVLLSERGLVDWPGAQGSYANGDLVFHHDMQHKVIGGHHFLAVSYWDVGQVLLNVDDPAAPVFVTDSDFTSPDPEVTAFQFPEGNSHQSYWSADGRYLLSTDEDFSPTRTLFEITSGHHAGQYSAREFSWTVPIGDRGVQGATVFGGSGCTEDANANAVSDRAEVPSAAHTGAKVVVFSRGTCLFSTKVESGQLAGYEVVVVGNSHAGSGNGLLPDAPACGIQGHPFTVTVSALCIGHRAMHLLFGDPPAYTPPEGYQPGGDLPPTGTFGQPINARELFDGWGYVHLHDGATLQEIDTYAIPEALDPAFATGFGNLTVHEVKTDPRRGASLAYASWYDAGLRVLSFGPGGLEEVGHYIAPGGNDFWGVFPHCVPACADNEDDPDGHGADRPLLLMSDRDSGLWILRYTGPEH